VGANKTPIKGGFLAATATAALLAVVVAVTFAPRQSAAGPTPSFDCSGSLSRSEVTICSDEALSDLDVALDAKFQRLLAVLSETDQQEWRDSEKDWLKRRGDCGDDKVCIRQAYVDRIDALNRKLQEVQAGQRPPAPSPSRPATARDREIGQSCERDSQCGTGHCEYHGSKGYVCAVAPPPPRPATSRLLEIGQSCKRASQCRTKHCEYHGSKGFVCAVAPQPAEKCRDPGRSCQSGVQCCTGMCDDKISVCVTH